ncbi:MAG: GNAT family N-acetyltransferase [Cytophagales bacterium]|nr:GNAT family N-acetyltransferase [Cytophagales bacterium]
MQIVNSTKEDVEFIFKLYRIASAYQKSKGVVVWPEFDREMVETEIEENRQWKILIDGQIACIWATTFSDEAIWEEKNAEQAIYIHRLAVNPDFKGNNFVQLMVDWARDLAKKHNKEYLRLDTLGHNKGLIKHYTAAGFTFLGIFHLTDTAELPLHYQREKDCCLFEMSV